MASPRRVTRHGNGYLILMDDGNRYTAVHDGPGTYLVSAGAHVPPDPDPDPEPGAWWHPLGPDWPRGTYTSYSGEPSHDAGALDFGTGYGGEEILYSPCAGKIVESNYDITGALVIVIQPTGESVGIAYAHCNRSDVTIGQTVSPGTPVGVTGWTGNVAPAGPGGAHLHLEVRTNGAAWGAWVPALSYFTSKGVSL